jgi:hypothetical protein
MTKWKAQPVGWVEFFAKPINFEAADDGYLGKNAQPFSLNPSCYLLRFPALLSLGKPMQVVVPSVSLAETLQGAAFTGVRGTISSGDLSALPGGSCG